MSVHGSAAAAFARLQQVSSSAVPETKSSTPDGLPADEASVEALAAAVSELVPSGREHDFAQALVACMTGGELRLQGLEPAWRPLAYALTPAAWALLDRMAGEGGIVRVGLAQAGRSEDIPGLARGLAMLPGLTHLDLPVPRCGPAIDLSSLHASGRPHVLRLHCVRADAWRVTVPAGCRVHASGPVARQLHLLKPTVSYINAAGQPTGERHALSGVPYLGKPPASIVAASSGDQKAARRLALEINTNGTTQFDDEGVAPTESAEARTIWCRHIAWKVGDDWQERRALQKSGAPAKMSYEPYVTPQALRAHVKRDTEVNLGRDLSLEPVALFTDTGWGQALQAQFDSLPPGQARAYLLVTLSHAMTLEVQRKGGNCIVTCYDPNVSTLPVKLLVCDPSHLRGVTLAQLLACWHPRYVPSGTRVSGALFALGGANPPSGEPGRLYGFDDEVLASREGLYWLVSRGVAGAIERSVEAIVAAHRDKPHSLLRVRLSTAHEGFNGLLDAVNQQRTSAAAAYIDAVLRHALPVLGVDATSELLAGLHLGDDATVLHAGIEDNPDFIAAFVRCVLAVPGLDTSARVRLLTLPSGQTLLQEALRDPGAGSGDGSDLPPRLQALTAILNAIFTAPGFDAASLTGLLAGLAGADPWTAPFTERLAAGDPVPAALLLSACLHPESPGILSPESLAPSLDVDTVLKALHAQPGNLIAQRCAQWLASDHEARQAERSRAG